MWDKEWKQGPAASLVLFINTEASLIVHVICPFVSFERMHSYHTKPVQTCVCVILTDSELQIALVALFSEMLYRFPNVVVAQLTRESVQQAIANGITAQQVLLH